MVLKVRPNLAAPSTTYLLCCDWFNHTKLIGLLRLLSSDTIPSRRYGQVQLESFKISIGVVPSRNM